VPLLNLELFAMTDTIKPLLTLAELTQDLNVDIRGETHCLIEGVGTIQDAGPKQIAFLMNPLYRKFLAVTQAAAVILTPEYAAECPVTAIVTTNPYFVYAKVAAYFDDRPPSLPGIHSTAVIGKECQIAKSVSIGAHCVIGNHVKIEENTVIAPGCVIEDWAEIGSGTALHANVTVYHRVRIGKNVIVASGAVIGSDGFGLAKQQGKWHKVPQLGTVIIEDNVEIGANCAIDRGAIDNTVIKKGAKLDNLIQVGHNVHIGENTAIAGCVGIAGSATIGQNCMIGGGAGIGGHITLADNVAITGMTVVSKSIRQPGVYSSGVGGVTTNKDWRKNSARVHRLEQLVERIKILEEKNSAGNR
jgi:UDP-3-O-[3-hydroxymyristoyl] glucosamine N-acyltransferase